jgi:hypothetical protein
VTALPRKSLLVRAPQVHHRKKEEESMARTRKQRTTREAIVKVLTDNGGEMTTKQVVEKALPLATGLKSKTREHTVYTTMLAESKKPNGLVVQVKPGLYRLRKPEESAQPETPDAEAVEVTPHPKPSTRKRSTARKSKVATPA